MRIKVLHYYTSQGGYRELGELTQLNRAEYCSRHNYDLIVDTADYSAEFSNKEILHNTKFLSIRANLNDCDYLVWIDADILIMNPEIKLEEFFTDKSITHPHYRQDNSYCDLHNGLIVFKNDDISRFYINMCCDSEIRKATQVHFANLMILDEEISNYVVNTTPTLKQNIGIIEFSKIYSNVVGIRELSQCDILKPYNIGDFILHLSNPLPQQLKIYYARKYISLCEQYQCGYIMPVEILKEHLKTLGLSND